MAIQKQATCDQCLFGEKQMFEITDYHILAAMIAFVAIVDWAFQ